MQLQFVAYLKQLWLNDVEFEIPQIMWVQRLKFLGTTAAAKKEKLSMKAKHIP